MSEFETQFKNLNEEQRKAVEHTEGPVLVIAGPGTGKTQLLSTRAAYILQHTDAQPHNLLCLTYTESAAFEMRQRLVNIVGQKAYNITISTYHAFGSELLSRFPEYFSGEQDLQPADELAIHSILSEIVAGLPYDNALKKSGYYLKDVVSTIGDLKKALLVPDDIRKIAGENREFIATTSQLTKELLAGVSRISAKSIPVFQRLADATSDQSKGSSLSQLWQESLDQALETVAESGKTSAITEWKNQWLARDEDANFIVAGQNTTDKLEALAMIYEQYLHALHDQGLYDYEDMILRAIKGLQTHKDLRFTLQEQYLYIMLDEFQDTNGAQLELVKLLTDSPLHEGKPNILAVGDDDQAIFAFQGANYSHMLEFTQIYQDVEVITLTKNYRSHADILHTAHNIAKQIETRLHNNMEAVNKVLTAESKQLPKQAIIERHEFKSDLAQFAWVTDEITKLIKQGTDPNEIAIIAPKHKYLEPILPYLSKAGVPVRYEKREDILQDPQIMQLIRMCELISALGKQDDNADSLWPEVLSYAFWQIPTETIWQLSWEARRIQSPWIELLLADEKFAPIGLFFVRLSAITNNETLETVLDILVGVHALAFNDKEKELYTSPYFSYYFGKPAESTQQQDFWELLSNLTVLRQHLRERRSASGQQLYLADFLDFIRSHQEAEIKILNTSPYNESLQAVQIMSAYKAKGLEFEAVFMLACIDQAWGSTASSQSARIPLPPNLAHIRYGGASDDEKLRLLFVAITRAKHHLYMTSYLNNYANRPSARLRFLHETEVDGDVISNVLPTAQQKVVASDVSAPKIEDLSSYWSSRHIKAMHDVRFKQLLEPRLERFQLAPTHINAFTDVVFAGPESFFLNTLLRFPGAPSVDGEFGNAIHSVIEWIHHQFIKNTALPSLKAILQQFGRELATKNISQHDHELLKKRGHACLTAFIKQKADSFKADDLHEFDFRKEGVFVGHAHLTGKIDKMIINKTDKTITIVDYKTGKSFNAWKYNELKLHKYRQQLYVYKLLVEGSYTFADYTVTDAYLEFVEPDEQGNIQDLHLKFDSDELKRIRNIAVAVWDRIKKLDLPDVSTYDMNVKGVKAFEDDLLKTPLK